MENMEKELEEIKAIEEREIKELELMNENENREFYVYLHIRLDNMTPFYVGKGKRDRAYDLDRSDFHNSVRDEYDCKVVIIKDKLTESQAFRLEKRMIEYYVLTLGYGIPIDGYRDFSNNKYLTNFTWGGEGTSGYKFSDESKEKISEKLKGENHPMYGKNPYAGKTPEEMEEIRRKKSESMKGKNKGKNSYAGKTPEEMEMIAKKKSEAMKGKMAGEKHPLYGKHRSDEEKKKMSENSSKKQKVICITTGKTFDSITDAAIHYKVAQSSISFCCIGVRKHAGKLNGVRLQWKYAENDDNESKAV